MRELGEPGSKRSSPTYASRKLNYTSAGRAIVQDNYDLLSVITESHSYVFLLFFFFFCRRASQQSRILENVTDLHASPAEECLSCWWGREGGAKKMQPNYAVDTQTECDRNPLGEWAADRNKEANRRPCARHSFFLLRPGFINKMFPNRPGNRRSARG